MTSTDAVGHRASQSLGFALCLAILLALTLVRLLGLWLSAADLYFDESQYWAWSRELSFGYYSKPPLLAWVIAGAERICGAGEACIRAPAPLFHLGTSLLVYAVARELYDGRVAFWAALTFALAPGVVFSTRIISTDVPLLFFWALALYAYVRLLKRATPGWAVVLGVSLGLGLLAKYAMVYFLPGVALAALVDRETRALLQTPHPWIALAIGALLLAPNLWWNAQHGFATFEHVGDNIQGSGVAFDAIAGLGFLAAQLAVIGPIAFAAILFAALRARAAATPRADRLMLAFVLPALVLVTLTAFTTRAHPNWAATAYVSGAVVAAAVLVRFEAWRLLAAGIAIGAVVQLALLAGDARAGRITIPGLAQPDVYAPTLGWRALGEETAALARTHGAPTVVADGRRETASLLYYARDGASRIVAWPAGERPSHHFDLTRPLRAGAAEPLLLVTRCADPARLARYYASIEPVGRFSTATGPTSQRAYAVFLLRGAKGPVGPLGRCR